MHIRSTRHYSLKLLLFIILILTVNISDFASPVTQNKQKKKTSVQKNKTQRKKTTTSKLKKKSGTTTNRKTKKRIVTKKKGRNRVVQRKQYSGVGKPNLGQIYRILPTDTTAADNEAFFEKYAEYYKLDKNHLINDSSLAMAFRKLRDLQRGKVSRFNILHLGDSHIQADYYSSWIKTELQKVFGSAGYGAFFPYSQAKTYTQRGFYSYSNTSWESVRNLSLEKDLKMGVMGYTVASMSNNWKLGIGVLPFNTFNNYFDKVTIFHSGDGEDVAVIPQQPIDYNSDPELPSLDNPVGKVVSVPFNEQHNQWTASTFYLSQATDNCILTSTENQRAEIYGGILEKKDAKGILYYTAGVGGSQLTCFTRSSLFMDQVKYMDPDLIIITLGANEAVGVDTVYWEAQARKFIKEVKEHNPAAGIIFMMPQDFLYRRATPKYLDAMMRTITRIGETEPVAIWDWNSVMGGRGAMQVWTSNGLGMGDYIHYSPSGYRLLGTLFRKSFMQSYDEYNQKYLESSK